MTRNTEPVQGNENEQFGYTPGPWSIDYDNGDAAEGARPEVIIETEERHIAFCFGPGTTNDKEAVADYHLIKAAPDLYEALVLFVNEAKNYHDCCGHDNYKAATKCDSICELIPIGEAALANARNVPTPKSTPSHSNVGKTYPKESVTP